MAKRGCKVVVVMGMVALALGGPKAAFGAEPEFRAMRILIITVAGVPPPDMLARAQAETARIYAAMGVRLIWEPRTTPTTAIGPADPLSSPARLTMLIISNPNICPERVAADALGAAPAAEDGVGRLAYAFHERIGASAQRHGTDPAKILAM
jgi:hypothetical protein